MSDFPLLRGLLGAAGAPLANWREIISAISDEFDRGPTTEDRIALLELFDSTMNIAEAAVSRTDLQSFRDARSLQYTAFIAQEAFIGEDVCVDTLSAITKREIDAGRMTSDNELRKIALESMAAPHYSRAEVMAACASPAPIPNGWQRAWAWLRY